MSEYTTRPRVRTVTASPQSTSPTGAAATAGLVVVGTALAVLLREAGRAWNATATDAVPAAGTTQLHSPRTLREQFSTEERQAAAALLVEHRAAPEAMKLATAIGLARTPLHACGENLRQPVADLFAASDMAAVEQARARLLEVVERDHLRAFVSQLSEAAAAASRDAGFSSVEVRSAADGVATRIIATDPAGRSLVSEVATDDSGEVNLATEAVGITDGSCHTALDDFDAALERRGVRSGQPTRVTTGGICELPFARAFIRDRGTHAIRQPGSQAPSSDSAELSRRRESNRPDSRTRTKS